MIIDMNLNLNPKTLVTNNVKSFPTGIKALHARWNFVKIWQESPDNDYNGDEKINVQ